MCMVEPQLAIAQNCSHLGIKTTLALLLVPKTKVSVLHVLSSQMKAVTSSPGGRD